MRNKSFEENMIKHIDENHDKIITTDQVFMEYKKNRQRVIIETLKLLGKAEVNIAPPAYLSESKPVKIISDSKKEIATQREKLKKRMNKVLSKPQNNDELYQCLQRLLKRRSEYHLASEQPSSWKKIESRAWRRFIAGYPPRKDQDTSIGDAINWEWIIECAVMTKKDKHKIIIVSRDSDYGVIYEKKPILNDWLSQEFKNRLTQQRNISFTNSLTTAFKLANVFVDDTEISDEANFIEKYAQHSHDDEETQFAHKDN